MSAPARRKAKLTVPTKVFEVKGRVLVLATFYVAATGTADAKKRLASGCYGRVDFEERTLRPYRIESCEELPA